MSKYTLGNTIGRPIGLNLLINYFGNKIKGVINYLSDDSKKPIYIDLKDKYLKNLNNTSNANVVLTNDFVENNNNTIRKAKDFKNTNDTILGDKKIRLSNISQFYGIENGKLKVGKLNDFNDNTQVIPIRNRNVGKIKKVILKKDSTPNYEYIVNKKYPAPGLIKGLFNSKKANEILRKRIKYNKELIKNKVKTNDYHYRKNLYFINENNDTLNVKTDIGNAFRDKILFSDENGNAIFVNRLYNDDIRNRLNRSLEEINLYPILVDNGRYSHYDLEGNVDGYVNPLDNRNEMFILGY